MNTYYQMPPLDAVYHYQLNAQQLVVTVQLPDHDHQHLGVLTLQNEGWYSCLLKQFFLDEHEAAVAIHQYSLNAVPITLHDGKIGSKLESLAENFTTNCKAP